MKRLLGERWPSVEFGVTSEPPGVAVDGTVRGGWTVVVRWRTGPATLWVRELLGYDERIRLSRSGYEVPVGYSRRRIATVGDDLPHLAAHLVDGLHHLGEHELAAQVPALPLVARCCDLPTCGSFYTVVPPAGPHDRLGVDRTIDVSDPAGATIILDVLADRIRFVETDDDLVARALERLAPPPRA